MKESRPSIGDWRDIYAAAVEFKKTKCWDWMMDSDIFGVQNPASGEIGYCCVMGHLGEHFALGIYLGTEGLETYLKIQRRELTIGDMEVLTSQKCLMASFEDKEELSDEDRKIIKKLGLRFRGNNQWPLFRSYLPGYPPWYLTKNEAEYLTLAMQQTVELSLRFKKDPDMLTPSKRNRYLVRVPEKANDGWQWTDEWLSPVPLEKSEIVVPPINEVRLQRIKKTVKRRGGTWECDFFFSPTPIKEGRGKPYYPYAVLYVDRQSGLILNADMMKPAEYMTEFPNVLMTLIENAEAKPMEIRVRKEEAFELLKLVAFRLNIKLKLARKLEMLEQAQMSMLQFFC